MSYFLQLYCISLREGAQRPSSGLQGLAFSLNHTSAPAFLVHKPTHHLAVPDHVVVLPLRTCAPSAPSACPHLLQSVLMSALLDEASLNTI